MTTGIGRPFLEIHKLRSGNYKVFIVGSHPDFLSAWSGWSGFCKHSVNGQPHFGFKSSEEAYDWAVQRFPTAQSLKDYSRHAPSTKMSDVKADEFLDSLIAEVKY